MLALTLTLLFIGSDIVSISAHVHPVTPEDDGEPPFTNVRVTLPSTVDLAGQVWDPPTVVNVDVMDFPVIEGPDGFFIIDASADALLYADTAHHVIGPIVSRDTADITAADLAAKLRARFDEDDDTAGPALWPSLNQDCEGLASTVIATCARGPKGVLGPVALCGGCEGHCGGPCPLNVNGWKRLRDAVRDAGCR